MNKKGNKSAFKNTNVITYQAPQPYIANILLLL